MQLSSENEKGEESRGRRSTYTHGVPGIQAVGCPFHASSRFRGLPLVSTLEARATGTIVHPGTPFLLPAITLPHADGQNYDLTTRHCGGLSLHSSTRLYTRTRSDVVGLKKPSCFVQRYRGRDSPVAPDIRQSNESEEQKKTWSRMEGRNGRIGEEQKKHNTERKDRTRVPCRIAPVSVGRIAR